MARRPTKPHVPHQSTLSPQDIRNAGTPEGTAMVNEELRRIKLALDAQQQPEEKETVAQQPQSQQGTQKPKAEVPPLRVLKNSVEVVSPTFEIDFKDSAEALILVSQTRANRAEVSVRLNSGAGIQAGWGHSKTAGIDLLVNPARRIVFYDVAPRRYGRSQDSQVALMNNCHTPVWWNAESSNGLAVVGYTPHNNVSISVTPHKSETQNITKLSTNVIRFKGNSHVDWHVEATDGPEEVGDGFEREGVIVQAETRCSSTRWDAPKWDNNSDSKVLYPLEDPYETTVSANDAQVVVFTKQNIIAPHGEVTQSTSDWRFTAHYDRGVYRVNSFLAVKDYDWDSYPLINPFLMLFKNGNFYSILDYRNDGWHHYISNETFVQNGTYAFVQLSPATGEGLALPSNTYVPGTVEMPTTVHGTDLIYLECGDYIDIRFCIGVAPYQPMAFAFPAYTSRTVVIRYGYVGVDFIDSCGCPDQDASSGFTHLYS